MQKRLWEIDLLRGIAIVMMIIFHFVFDLNFLGLAKIMAYEGAWLIFQRITISLFILLVGISLHISYSKIKDKSAKALLKKYGLRSIALFAVALGISLATWLVIPEGFVVFGIIHFVALAILVASLFLRFYILNLVLGLVLLVQGVFMPLQQIETSLLLWLGFNPPGFYSIDYVPLIPWFGLILLGIFLGRHFYPKGKRNFKIKEKKSGIVNILSYMGQRSLLIYLIHQPILLGLLQIYLFFS